MSPTAVTVYGYRTVNFMATVIVYSERKFRVQVFISNQDVITSSIQDYRSKEKQIKNLKVFISITDEIHIHDTGKAVSAAGQKLGPKRG